LEEMVDDGAAWRLGRASGQPCIRLSETWSKNVSESPWKPVALTTMMEGAEVS
jgi:hypothetical protein